MSTMTIRNIPDDLKRTIATEAKRNRRSMNQQVLVLLESSVDTTSTSPIEDKIRKIQKLRNSFHPLSQKEIEQGREEGRT